MKNHKLSLDQYRKQIKLDEPFAYIENDSLTDTKKDEIVNTLLQTLIAENPAEVSEIPDDYSHKRQLLRALLNVRPPNPLNEKFMHDVNRLLQNEKKNNDLVNANNLPVISDSIPETKYKNSNKMVLWKGDITSLKTEAIVNAANDQMLGCFLPLHNCIDNVIHSAAGPQLRQDCKTIMDITGGREQTGDAKITRAYNLPSKYVLHTVGPKILKIPVTKMQRDQLASCYASCLELAGNMKNIDTIAFPCISTGVFHFPRDIAAEIAVHAVDEWLNRNDNRFSIIIFNVYLQEDFDEYIRVFGK